MALVKGTQSVEFLVRGHQNIEVSVTCPPPPKGLVKSSQNVIVLVRESQNMRISIEDPTL